MGGSGSRSRSSGPAARAIVRSLVQTHHQDREAEVAQVFADALREINQFDTEASHLHRDTVCDALRREYDIYDIASGGSRTRYTYVNGLSDVDFLLDLGPYSESSLANKDDPSAVLRAMVTRIKQRLPNTEISAGRMAVTIRFSDGQELQVLPAFRYHSGYRVPDPQGGGWAVTHPRRFAELLRVRNGEVGGRLLRTIKLGKLICGNTGVDIKSYHLENIAVTAFERYVGPRTDEAMLRHLFNKAKSAVLRPMADITGQNPHVDQYLTSPGARRALALRLDAIERKVAAANGNPVKWREILDDE